jgi:DNA topoisomerase IB
VEVAPLTCGQHVADLAADHPSNPLRSATSRRVVGPRAPSIFWPMKRYPRGLPKHRPQGRQVFQELWAATDPRIARIVRRCQGLPGQELFHYVNDRGEVQSVGSTDVNAYLDAACKGKFTAKDFRTWHGSELALRLWRKLGVAEQLQPTTAQANRLLAQVADLLGNTLPVCRKSYVHPRVLALLAGEPESRKTSAGTTKRKAGLTASEQDFLALLAGSN